MELIQTKTDWQNFLAWVEGTSLFHAIKNDPPGTRIEAVDEGFALELQPFQGKIQNAIDLPKEILHHFAMNSPWSRTPIDHMEYWLNYTNQQKQLPDAN
jgi:hypothetical protein